MLGGTPSGDVLPSSIGSFGVFGTGQDEFDSMDGLAVHESRGLLLATDAGRGLLQAFDISGVNLTFTFSGALSGLRQPRGVTVDQASGDIFIAEFGANRILRCTLVPPTAATTQAPVTQATVTPRTVAPAPRLDSVGGMIAGILLIVLAPFVCLALFLLLWSTIRRNRVLEAIGDVHMQTKNPYAHGDAANVTTANATLTSTRGPSRTRVRIMFVLWVCVYMTALAGIGLLAVRCGCDVAVVFADLFAFVVCVCVYVVHHLRHGCIRQVGICCPGRCGRHGCSASSERVAAH